MEGAGAAAKDPLCGGACETPNFSGLSVRILVRSTWRMKLLGFWGYLSDQPTDTAATTIPSHTRGRTCRRTRMMNKETDTLKSLEESLKDLPFLLQERAKHLEEKERELAKAKRAFEKENPSFGQPSDVLTLNVGGRCITVLRRTLTSVEGSMLATRFSGRWDDSLEKDGDRNFFIDQNFELFELIIDHLRTMHNEAALGPPLVPPLEDFDQNNKKKCDFLRMVEYYGLTRAIYPLEFSLLRGDAKDVDMVCQPDNYSIDARECVELSFSPTPIHKRFISAFELTLGSVSVAKVGWKNKENASTVFFDCSDCTINCPVKSFTGTVHEVEITEGTVLRFEVDGNKWLVDGKLVAFCDTKASNVLQMQTLPNLIAGTTGYYVAYIEVKGKCRISAVEQYF